MNIIDLTDQLPVHSKKKAKVRDLSKIKKIVIHTTDWEIEPKELAEYDIGPNHIDSTGCPTATYHYYIGKDGQVSQLVKESLVTWHAALHNSNSIAICLAYKTDPLFESGKSKLVADINKPTNEMINSLVDLLVDRCIQLKISPTEIYGHRELIGTGFFFVKGHKQLRKTCPGMTIDLDVLRSRIFRSLQTLMKQKGLYNTVIDGQWGPRSQQGFQALLNYKD